MQTRMQLYISTHATFTQIETRYTKPIYDFVYETLLAQDDKTEMETEGKKTRKFNAKLPPGI